MKQVGEICKLIGVTRKTLRGYNDMGLLKPTIAEEGHPWLYDDEAVNKLRAIQVFAEAGYTRKEIKKLLESDCDLYAEFDHAIKRLEEKRDRIDMLIKMFRITKQGALLPASVKDILLSHDVFKVGEDKSFTESMEDQLQLLSIKLEEEDIPYAEKGVVLLADLTAIGALKDDNLPSEKVLLLVSQILQSLKPILLEDFDEHDSDGMSDKELTAIATAILVVAITESGWDGIIEKQVGVGSADYTIRVLTSFGETQVEQPELFHEYVNDFREEQNV